METKSNFIQMAYEAALKAGLCHNKSQFAELVKLNRSALYAIDDPSPKTITLVEKILAEHGVFINESNVQVGDNNTSDSPQVPQDESHLAFLKEITAAREMYDRHISKVLEQNSELLQILKNHEH